MTETQKAYPDGGVPEGSPEKNPVSFIQDNRKAVVDQLILLIEEGKTFYSPRWSSSAMRPRNPISGALYHGSNRLILMQSALLNGYKDPRWMTFKQLSEKGYFVKKGERAVRLEKWIFTQMQPKEGPDGLPMTGRNGKVIYEEVQLDRPRCNLFSVFNGEQIKDFPKYEPKELLSGELGRRIEALLQSSECPIHEAAQDKSFYKPGTDEIYLPLRSSFRDMTAFAEVAAHEMVHSTGHPGRLNREFGIWPPLGKPDEKYCLEELRAELGSVFLMNDLEIPVTDLEMEGSAAYMEGYLNAIKENPNLLFRIASDAEKAGEYLLRNYRMVYDIDLSVEPVPEHKKTYFRQMEEPAMEKGLAM